MNAAATYGRCASRGRFGAAGGITDGVLRHQSLGQIALDGRRGWRSGRAPGDHELPSMLDAFAADQFDGSNCGRTTAIGRNGSPWTGDGTPRLAAAKPGRYGRWASRCPGHRTQSMTI
jgi:hypothetical protein